MRQMSETEVAVIFLGLQSSAQLGKPLVAKAWPLISEVYKLTR